MRFEYDNSLDYGYDIISLDSKRKYLYLTFSPTENTNAISFCVIYANNNEEGGFRIHEGDKTRTLKYRKGQYYTYKIELSLFHDSDTKTVDNVVVNFLTEEQYKNYK